MTRIPISIKISDPGSIYGGGTLKDIKMGIQSFRNPDLVLLLNRLGYIENYGMGIQRIFEAYQGKDAPPSFYISERYFQLTLPNMNQGNQKDVNVVPNEISVLICKLVKENPKISRKEMADQLKVSIKTIERTIQEINNLKYVGHAPHGYWVITDGNNGQ